LLTTGPARYSNLALAFSMPLFNTGRLKATVERLSSRERVATLQFQQATLKALQDVENSLITLDKERERNRALEAATHERRTAVKLAQSLAREGQVNQLRVLEVQRGELAAEVSALESHTELVLGAIQLFKAMGGGWQVAVSQSPPETLAATWPAISSSLTTSNAP
jgi:outer membrane protein TolC